MIIPILAALAWVIIADIVRLNDKPIPSWYKKLLYHAITAPGTVIKLIEGRLSRSPKLIAWTDWFSR